MELSTIIKEVADELIEHFHMKVLETGWDTSVPDGFVKHILKRPTMGVFREFSSLEFFSELKGLLGNVNSNTLSIYNPDIEDFIASSLWESINSPGINVPCMQQGNERIWSKKVSYDPASKLRNIQLHPYSKLLPQDKLDRIVRSSSKLIIHLLDLVQRARENRQWSSKNQITRDYFYESRSSCSVSGYPFGKEMGASAKATSTNWYNTGINASQRRASQSANASDTQQVHTNKSLGCTLFKRMTSDSISGPFSSNDDIILKKNAEMMDSSGASQHNTTTNDSLRMGVDYCRYPLVPPMNCAYSPSNTSESGNSKNVMLKKNLSTEDDFKKPTLTASPLRRGLRRSNVVSGDAFDSKLKSNVLHTPREQHIRHADKIMKEELLNQARRYGTSAFAKRLESMIQDKPKTLRYGYWLPTNRSTRLESLHRTELNKDIKKRQSSEVSSSMEQHPIQENRMRKRRYSTSSSKNCIPSSAGKNTETAKNNLLRTAAFISQRHSKETKTKQKNVKELLHLPGFDLSKPIHQQRLRSLAAATAGALAEIVGIPSSTKTSALNDFIQRSCNRRSTFLGKTMGRHKKRALSETKDERNHAIYRVRVESMRYPKHPFSTVEKIVDETVVLNTGTPPSATSATSSSTSIIPPMSITLCGARYLSPCLKLSDADYAHLGKVAGQPVIVPGAHLRSSSSQTSTRSGLRGGCNLEDGYPQVDYFAVVCTDLGRLVAVNVKPVSFLVKEGDYDWFIKSFVIDDMTNCKRYSFACDQWLRLEETEFTCQNVTATGRSRSPNRIPTPHTFQHLLGEVPTDADKGDRTEVVKLSRLFPLSPSTVNETAQSIGSIPLIRGRYIVGQGDMDNLCTPHTVTVERRKTSVESLHVKLPRLVKSWDVTDAETCVSSSPENGLDILSTETCEKRPRIQLTAFSSRSQELCMVENRLLGNEATWPHCNLNHNGMGYITLIEKAPAARIHVNDTNLFNKSDTGKALVQTLESTFLPAILRDLTEFPANACSDLSTQELTDTKSGVAGAWCAGKDSLVTEVLMCTEQGCYALTSAGVNDNDTDWCETHDKIETEIVRSLHISSSSNIRDKDQLVNKIDLRLSTVTVTESVNDLEPLEDPLPANVNTTSEDVQITLQLVDLYFDPNYSDTQRTPDSGQKPTSFVDLTSSGHGGTNDRNSHDLRQEAPHSVNKIGVENQSGFVTPSDTRLSTAVTPNYDVDDFWNSDSHQSCTQTNNNTCPEV